ncbi:MATE family efflux transporter, partial [Acinetobacter baumannii]|nr:MATE family efflux transporter [Acinetobacter baumannii]
TRFSVLKSQQAHEEANVVYTHTLVMAAAASVVFVLAGLTVPGPLAALLGAEGTVHTMTTTYLRVLLIFAPAF